MLTYDILLALAFVAAAAAMASELRRDLMMLQQNSYFNDRYRRWLSASADTTSALRITGMAVLLLAISTLVPAGFGAALMGLFGTGVCARLATRRYKKPLVMTARARRILATAVALAAIVVVAAAWLAGGGTTAGRLYAATAATTACYCASHLLLLAANTLLRPVERGINARYIADARERLRSMPDLKVIGITGSYGKTSTKHYLHRILSEHFDTLMTPGSYNTTLGVVRTVRELLRPYNEVFIVEMGAKQRGDIREICDLVRPSAGIITAVGPQHLESFGSIEAVQATKFELADALPSDGTAYVNDDFPLIASRPVEGARCMRYSCTGAPEADWQARDISYGSDGTHFTVTGPGGFALELHTRLLGEANISDLLAAVAVAADMGVPSDKIRYAVGQIEPVTHRMSLTRTAGGFTIIDDAYNSNPVGSRMAMEVLGSMSGGQRIVITPGMIELGDEQQRLNRELGRHAGLNADIVIVVGHYNREALSQGVADAGRPEVALHTADTFADAQRLLTSVVRPGDTVLYENDLPDTFR